MRISNRTRTGICTALAAVATAAAFCTVKILYRQDLARQEAAADAKRAMESLEASAGDNYDIAAILENRDAYPEQLLNELAKNSELIDFVLGYPGTEGEAGGFTAEELEAEHPLLMQWDTRWGYAEYGSGLLGMNGCGPTCLSMVLLELTENTDATPDAVARYAEKEGYCVPGNGTKWSLMFEGCREWGVEAAEVPLWEGSMKRELEDGRPIVCCMGPGDFTGSGHFIVIYGFDGQGFRVNDPNSRERSGKSWSYESISDQIRGMWSFGI